MLTGQLVTLRAIEDSDLERLASFSNDLEVEVLGGGDPPRPRSFGEVKAVFEKRREGGASFAIVADGEVIGDLGLFNFSAVNRSAEVGIGIGDRAYWGRGYGREAVRLITDYGFRYHNLRKIYLSTHGTNERAIRSYAAAGFVEEGRLKAHVWSEGAFVDLVYMARFAGS